jgi:FkbM family methyltransferase
MIACGLGGVGRSVRTMAREHGVRLKWRWHGVWVCLPEFDCWYSRDHFWGVLPLIAMSRGMQRRGVFLDDDSRRVGWRLGEPLRVRQWDSAKRLWHGAFPELVDTTKGYFLRGAPQPGEVAFDLGSYVGEIAVSLAEKVGPSGRVFAFEPHDGARHWLTVNAREHAPDVIEVRREGIWRESGEFVFQFDRLIGASLVSEPEGYHEKVRHAPITTLSLVEACEKLGVVPNFIKMDVEGAELEIVESSLEFIARHNIRFAIASYHVRDGEPTSVRLTTLFESIGYQVETGYSDHLTTWAWRDN